MKRIRFYYVAVFLSAFLLFQIQPMTSKALLPGFGGSYLVWAGCMVFYQGMLLAGYVYAHLAQRRPGAAIGMGWTEDFAMGTHGAKRVRNSYGVYKVFDSDNQRYLHHGTTLHGRQYVSGPESKTLPAISPLHHSRSWGSMTT